MKTIILAGNPGNALFPLANGFPKLALPVGDRPLVAHLFDRLRTGGASEVGIVANGQMAQVRGVVRDLERRERMDLPVWFFEEHAPRGTAGSIKALEDFLGHDDFLLIAGSVYLGSLDLFDLRATHRMRNAALTAVLQPGRHSGYIENVELDADGRILRVCRLHASRERRRTNGHTRPPVSGDRRHASMATGVYVVSPSVFSHIPPSGYVDLKEQLVPALNAAGLGVFGYDTRSDMSRVDSLDAYLELQARVLTNDASRNRIVAPGSIIESRAAVHCSSLGSSTRVMTGARVELSLLADGSTVQSNQIVRNAVAGSTTMPVDPSLVTPSRRSSLTRLAADGTKRTIDIAMSLSGLIFLSPLFAALAVLIKLDSRGPVLFLQRRCGKHGREFTMLKFRTMVPDADARQKDLFAAKDVDGPMFKLNNDPRVTRLGRILRKTSLDELPQLLNVLRGEMSMVGPRPLVMDEMKFAPSWRDMRLHVRPGISGLWQVNGRSDVAFHDWITHDIEYVNTRSLRLDMWILMRTLRALRIGKGAK